MRWLAVAILALAPSADAASPEVPFPVSPIYVSVIGTTAIRVRIWTGSVMPCDSGKTKLLDAKVQPGFEATYWSDEQSVCVEHTTRAFPDVDWVPPRLVYRPTICLRWVGYGKWRRCAEWAAVPLNIVINPP